MDDIILIIFTAITVLLLLVGIFRKQKVLTIFAGIFFILLGVFLQQGVDYIGGGNFVDSSFTTTNLTYVNTTWHSAYATPLLFAFGLFGLTLILMSAVEMFRDGKKKKNRNIPEEEEE